LTIRLISEGPEDDTGRIAWVWSECTSRAPSEAEIEILAALLRDGRARYSADEKAARELAAVGLLDWPADLPVAELAAWTAVTRAALNVHECIARN
jgi:hypothetical protein